MSSSGWQIDDAGGHVVNQKDRMMDQRDVPSWTTIIEPHEANSLPATTFPPFVYFL